MRKKNSAVTNVIESPDLYVNSVMYMPRTGGTTHAFLGIILLTAGVLLRKKQ